MFQPNCVTTIDSVVSLEVVGELSSEWRRGFARNNVDYAPIAALPKSADDAPLTISIRSTFSTAIRARSSLPAIRPTCGSPSSRIRI